MLCDPKGRANELEAEPVTNYFIADILQYGNIQARHQGNAAFFEKYYDRLWWLTVLIARPMVMSKALYCAEWRTR